MTSDNLVFIFNNEEYSLQSFYSIWYRRGGFNISFCDQNNSYLAIEEKAILDNIYRLLFKNKHLNTYLNSDFNKLELINYNNFKIIKIPETIVTQDKNELLNFYQKNKKKIISKPIAVPFSISTEKGNFMSYTSKISLNDINKLPTLFIPTLFQEQIRKKYEIRTFVLNKKMYSMCIFSQKNRQTKVDFRVYDENIPNRVSPFQLPVKIENELFEMLDYFSIDCASLDLIYATNNKFYIIDINPVGQFGMVSLPCNYQLELRIAKYLSQ